MAVDQRALRHPLKLALALCALFCAACGLILPDYRIDSTTLDGGSCELGDHRCSADWLLTCNRTLDGWVRESACERARLCDSRGGRCAACSTGEYRCTGAKLEVCRADRSGWDLVQDCGSEPCNVKLAACAPCTPAEYQCNAGGLSQCTAAGIWGPPTSCGAAELCEVSDDRRTGQCSPSVGCMPGTYSCMEARLLRCDAQGVALQPIETCATAGLCQETLMLAASGDQSLGCVRPSCDANAFRCDGNQLLACAADRSEFMPQASCTPDNPCNPSTGACGKCTPGAVVCQGAELLRCNASGAFDKIADCPSAALCDPTTAACDAAECAVPGRFECDPFEPFLKTCGADLKWRRMPCETTALCNAIDGRCEVPVCESAAQRCDRRRFQRCNAGRTGWDTVRECASGSECDPASGECTSGACQPGAHRCNDVYVESCTSQGSWQRVSRCAAHSLCNAADGTCNPPECALGTFRCLDNGDLEACGSDRQWRVFTTCVGTRCDDIGGKCL